MLKKMPFSPIILISLISLTLFACAGKDNAKSSVTESTPSLETKSECGNEPHYTINGHRYSVLTAHLAMPKMQPLHGMEQVIKAVKLLAVKFLICSLILRHTVLYLYPVM